MRTPTVTQILRDELGDLLSTGPWFKTLYFRRGRIVDYCLSLIARGGTISDEWWAGNSGDPSLKNSKGEYTDYLEHEQCREYVEAGAAWLRYSGFHYERGQFEVVNSVGRYRGHPDAIFSRPKGDDALIDYKCGDEAFWHPLQLQGYKDAIWVMEKRNVERFNLYLPSGKLVLRNDPRDARVWRLLTEHWHYIESLGGH